MIAFLRSFSEGSKSSVTDLKYDKEPLTDFNLVEKEFDLYLTRCLEDIFDLDKPFSQTTVESHCKYCDFKQLCKR